MLTIVAVAIVTFNRFIISDANESAFGHDIVASAGWNLLGWFYRWSILEQGTILPLWFRFMSAGGIWSVLSDPSALIMYPPVLLPLVLAPNELVGIRYSIVVHVIISGLSMYFLMMQWKQAREASLMGAIGYMLTGSVFYSVLGGTLWALYGYAWIPLAIALLEISVRKNSATWGLLAGFVLSLLVQSGAGDLFFRAIPLVIMYSLFLVVRHRKFGNTKSVLSPIRVLLTALLSIPLYLAARIATFFEVAPFLYLRHMSGVVLDWKSIFSASANPYDLLAIFESRSFLEPIENPVNESASYVGVLLLLALLALPLVLLTRRRDERGRTLFLIGTTAFYVCLSAGGYLINMWGTPAATFFSLLFLFVPFLTWIRIAGRYLILTQLTIAALAATTLTCVQGSLAMRGKHLRSRLLAYGLVLIVIVDMVTFGLPCVQTVSVPIANQPGHDLFSDSQVAVYMRTHLQQDEPFRIYGYGFHSIEFYSLAKAGFESVQGPPFLTPISYSRYWEQLEQSDWPIAYRMLGLLNVKYVVANRLPGPGGLSLIMNFSDGTYLFRNDCFVPRAFALNHGILVISPDRETWESTAVEIISRPLFDARKLLVVWAKSLDGATIDYLSAFAAVYIPGGTEGGRTTGILGAYVKSGGVVLTGGVQALDAILGKSIASVDTDRVHLRTTDYKLSSMTIEVKTDRPMFLFISEVQLPGWRVQVNGTQVEPLQTNGIFMGTILRRGLSHVEIEFRPASYDLGIAITGCAHLALVVALGRNTFSSIFRRLGLKSRYSRATEFKRTQMETDGKVAC